MATPAPSQCAALLRRSKLPPSHPAPSQFAALLRRSKFASYDPEIDQVYTTFDGHAARGNFGLKRPLALHRRNAHITVQAVDSRELQTVWKSAERQNRWIRMWDEVGVTPKLGWEAAWRDKLGPLDVEVHFLVDSEFTRTEGSVEARETAAELAETEEETFLAEEEMERLAEPEVLVKMSHAVPNLDAMSETEFGQYLVRLRSLRPAFLQFLQTKYKNGTHGGKTLFQHSLRGGDDFREFLQSHAYQGYRKKRPRYIEQQPHRFAGLSYTHAPDIQTFKTTKPHIGRILGDTVSDRTSEHYVVASAGMTSRLNTGAKGEETDQVSGFRFTNATLFCPPEVVGPGQKGLKGAYIGTLLRVDSPAVAYKEENPYTPGTREYVVYTNQKRAHNAMGITAPPPPRAQFTVSKDNEIPAQNLLSALYKITSQPESSS